MGSDADDDLASAGAPRQPRHGYQSIEIDLRGIRDCAAALRAELETIYIPYRDQVNRDMVVEESRPDERFRELCDLLYRHWFSRFMTTALLTEHGNATYTFAATAQTIGTRHGDTDGLAKARAEDIDRYLDTGRRHGALGER